MNTDNYIGRCHGPSLREDCSALIEPRHSLAKKMVAIWKARPAGGLVVGRDVPSKDTANLLAHITVWDVVGDFDDLYLRHSGEMMRVRYGDTMVGKYLSELVSPDVFKYCIAVDRDILENDGIAIVEHTLSENAGKVGIVRLRCEVISIAGTDRDGRRVIISGVFHPDN